MNGGTEVASTMPWAEGSRTMRDCTAMMMSLVRWGRGGTQAIVDRFAAPAQAHGPESGCRVAPTSRRGHQIDRAVQSADRMNDATLEIVAHNVRAARGAAGLSLDALAARADVSKGALVALEGARGNPNLATLVRLA